MDEDVTNGEGFCNTVSRRIPTKWVYGSGLGGVLLFGGLAWGIGGGFAPPSLFAGALWIVAGLVGGVALLVPLVVLHEVAHYLAFRSFGVARARFGWVMHNGKPVAPSVSGSGKWISRAQYRTVILAPTVFVSVVGVLLMMLMPVLRGALAVALTLHLMGCVNDWMVFHSVARLPRGTKIEDREKGFAYR